MSEIILCGSNIKTLVDDDVYDDLVIYKWYIHPKGYAQAWIDGKITLMHRMIMQPGKKQVDHMDGNKLNNRRSNLRLVSQSQNIQNTPPRCNNTSGYVGVSRNGPYWQANIYKDGKRFFIGNFKDKNSAAVAYNKRALSLYGKNAYLNTISHAWQAAANS